MMTTAASAAEVQAKPHVITIKERKSLIATGVQEVVAYDENSATVETACGTLVVGGANLRVHEISTVSGELSIEGNIEYIQYEARKTKGEGGFFKRLVR
ncbi:MAG: YabP/YqfC family sporulation protein [Oscillospiraceae bacterium]|nr:YabP/YqfC family sporulation protein [Oscillospiraceae bacterium]